jgi:carbamoylphosphate synthase large subunit
MPPFNPHDAAANIDDCVSKIENKVIEAGVAANFNIDDEKQRLRVISADVRHSASTALQSETGRNSDSGPTGGPTGPIP